MLHLHQDERRGSLGEIFALLRKLLHSVITFLHICQLVSLKTKVSRARETTRLNCFKITASEFEAKRSHWPCFDSGPGRAVPRRAPELFLLTHSEKSYSSMSRSMSGPMSGPMTNARRSEIPFYFSRTCDIFRQRNVALQAGEPGARWGPWMLGSQVSKLTKFHPLRSLLPASLSFWVLAKGTPSWEMPIACR